MKYYKVVRVDKNTRFGAGDIPNEYALSYAKGVPTVSEFKNGKVFAFGCYKTALYFLKENCTPYVLELWSVEVVNPNFITKCYPLWYNFIETKISKKKAQDYWNLRYYSSDYNEVNATSPDTYICDSINLVKCLKRIKR